MGGTAFSCGAVLGVVPVEVLCGVMAVIGFSEGMSTRSLMC